VSNVLTTVPMRFTGEPAQPATAWPGPKHASHGDNRVGVKSLSPLGTEMSIFVLENKKIMSKQGAWAMFDKAKDEIGIEAVNRPLTTTQSKKPSV
jgi:hypothetical protein